MKIKDKGFDYLAYNYGTKEIGQPITFVKKQTAPQNEDESYVKTKGTTSEEVVDILIDRVETIGKSNASDEAVEHLKKAKILISGIEY